MQATFDSRKPHGTIWGHPHAQYEQNGVLFNAAGDPLTEEQLKPREKEAEHKALSAEAEFLMNLLIGGVMRQTNVKRESEERNLVWADVLATAADMGVQIYKQGNQNVWKLVVED